MSSNVHFHPSALSLNPDEGTTGQAGARAADQALLAECLRLLAPTVLAERTAVRLLDRFGSIGAAMGAEPQDLRRLGLTTPVQASVLSLLKRLCVAMAREEAARQPVVSSWSALLAYVRTAQANASREAFRCLFLDRKNRLLWDEMVTDDPTVQAAVDRRIERLLDATAARIVAGGSLAEASDRERA